MAKRKRSGVLYQSYRFRGQDPIVGKTLTALKASGQKRSEAHRASGVSTSTLYNWERGYTMRPQFCTIAAVLGSCDKQLVIADRR